MDVADAGFGHRSDGGVIVEPALPVLSSGAEYLGWYDFTSDAFVLENVEGLVETATNRLEVRLDSPAPLGDLRAANASSPGRKRAWVAGEKSGLELEAFGPNALAPVLTSGPALPWGETSVVTILEIFTVDREGSGTISRLGDALLSVVTATSGQQLALGDPVTSQVLQDCGDHTLAVVRRHLGPGGEAIDGQAPGTVQLWSTVSNTITAPLEIATGTVAIVLGGGQSTAEVAFATHHEMIVIKGPIADAEISALMEWTRARYGRFGKRRRLAVVTAGQSNAGFRISDEGLMTNEGWDRPLETVQNPILQRSLGLIGVRDLGERSDPRLVTAVGGCTLMRSAGNCYFIDDMSSADPNEWMIGNVGQGIVRKIRETRIPEELIIVSWIHGESDAAALSRAPDLPGHQMNGGPYSYATPEEWAAHYQRGLTRFLPILREATGVPDLRIAMQLIAHYLGAPDLVRRAQLEAANNSNGGLFLSSANPWQHYAPNGSDPLHYAGATYHAFALETARTIGWALRMEGLNDMSPGPAYGRFPQITGVRVVDSAVLVEVSNPNEARTLILPENPQQGWSLRKNGAAVEVRSVVLAAPFTLRIETPEQLSSDDSVELSYGTNDHRPMAGAAITDDADQVYPVSPNYPIGPGNLVPAPMPLAIY